MKFSEVPGLVDLKETLVSSFKRNHLAHAQLFSGNEGGPALALAMAFATYLLCENKSESDACGSCSSCQKMQKLIHPDVHFFYPAPKAEKDKELSIQSEAWRKFLLEEPFGQIENWIAAFETENKVNQISKEDARRIVKAVSMKSFEGGLKIILIWYPEKMHPSAANAILKALEEPPEQTLFFLITYNYEDLLTTILSRTQLVVVPTLSTELVSEYLVDHHGVPKQNALRASLISDGSISLAINSLRTSEDLDFSIFQNWMRFCLSGAYDELVVLSEDFHQYSKAKQKSQLQFALELIRSSILTKGGSDLGTLTDDEKNFISKFSSAIALNGLDLIYQEINTGLYHLERNANPKITHLALSIRLSQILRTNRV